MRELTFLLELLNRKKVIFLLSLIRIFWILDLDLFKHKPIDRQEEKVESQESSSSSDEEDSKEYTDSSFSREERQDKTILTKLTTSDFKIYEGCKDYKVEEFKGYTDEDPKNLSPPVFEYIEDRKNSIPKRMENKPDGSK